MVPKSYRAEVKDRLVSQLARAGLSIIVLAGLVTLPTQSFALNPVDDATLDSQRGGYSLGQFSFNIGILRTVFVNGSPVATAGFNIADLPGPNTAETTSTNSSATSNGSAFVSLIGGDRGLPTMVIQNGPGNVSLPNTSAAGITSATLIQNTLSNQSLKVTTAINLATIGLLNLGRLNSFGVSLQQPSLGQR